MEAVEKQSEKTSEVGKGNFSNLAVRLGDRRGSVLVAVPSSCSELE